MQFFAWALSFNTFFLKPGTWNLTFCNREKAQGNNCRDELRMFESYKAWPSVNDYKYAVQISKSSEEH